jgi:hypothetical protein
VRSVDTPFASSALLSAVGITVTERSEEREMAKGPSVSSAAALDLRASRLVRRQIRRERS